MLSISQKLHWYIKCSLLWVQSLGIKFFAVENPSKILVARRKGLFVYTIRGRFFTTPFESFLMKTDSLLILYCGVFV